MRAVHLLIYCTVFRYSANSVLPQSTERQSLVSKVEADEKSKENEALGEAGETKRKQLLAKKREILVHVPNCQSSQLPVANVLKHMKKKPKQLGTKKRKIIVQVPSCQCSEPWKTAHFQFINFNFFFSRNSSSNNINSKSSSSHKHRSLSYDFI